MLTTFCDICKVHVPIAYLQTVATTTTFGHLGLLSTLASTLPPSTLYCIKPCLLVLYLYCAFVSCGSSVMYSRLGLSCLESNNPRFCCLRTYSRERRLVYRTRPIVDTSRGYLRTAFEYSSSYHPLCLRLPLGRLFRTRTKPFSIY